jgi:hypothetical protein
VSREITLDQQLAKTAGTRLAVEFETTFGVETIQRFLTSSYDQFADRATMLNFIPLLAERFAASAFGRSPRSKARWVTASQWCCSCAPATQVAPRWRSGSSPTTPAAPRSPGRAAPNPGSR